MKFNTENSAYEINKKTKQIRRLSGVSNPTPRQGKDGEWKKYESISEIKLNYPITIIWCVEEGIIKTTVTSNIVKIGG
jgi:hypothetical protein